MTRTANSILPGAEAPRVLTVPMIAAALADRSKPVARGTLFRWIRAQTASGALRPVTRGLYLNQLAQPRPSAAEATGYVRSGAIVSLQTVLGDAGVTNSYSDIVTCIVPIRDGKATSSRTVKAADTEFRFHAMPIRLLDDRAGSVEDRLDSDVYYPRASPEKALLDWIYLGASPYTKLSGPPLDIDMTKLNSRTLKRLAKAMRLTEKLDAYLARKRRYDRAPDVIANTTL